ncbi:MAG: thymidine phosphorylase [Ruminococcaceae bacterium]|nr:thymidine phosphorylase [Oscillospiraceae bacterium]
MNIIEIIEKKRDGYPLSDEEIKFFVRGVTDGSIPDYQISSLLMAIVLNSMDDNETAVLTYEMAHSGYVQDLSMIPGLKADKHSTGGVGDKTSLVCVPVAAACGVPVAKLSGRGLGHTGGTIDKLESIPGFSADVSMYDFIKNVNEIGLCISASTAELAPADKKLYALRDVTGTVQSIPLIASSIMSKKIATGSDCIILDVKAGCGAFMKNEAEAKALADAMIKAGRAAGKKVSAVISDMNVPLGTNIGNSIEVIEAIEALKCRSESHFYDTCKKLASEMVSLSLDIDIKDAQSRCEKALESGAALEKFEKMISRQGGNSKVIEDYSLFKQPRYSYAYRAPVSGKISNIDALLCGKASCLLGAGRLDKASVLDLSAGITLKASKGDTVKKGDILACLYSDKSDISDTLHLLENSYSFEEK